MLRVEHRHPPYVFGHRSRRNPIASPPWPFSPSTSKSATRCSPLLPAVADLRLALPRDGFQPPAMGFAILLPGSLDAAIGRIGGLFDNPGAARSHVHAPLLVRARFNRATGKPGRRVSLVRAPADRVAATLGKQSIEGWEDSAEHLLHDGPVLFKSAGNTTCEVNPQRHLPQAERLLCNHMRQGF